MKPYFGLKIWPTKKGGCYVKIPMLSFTAHAPPPRS